MPTDNSTLPLEKLTDTDWCALAALALVTGAASPATLLRRRDELRRRRRSRARAA